MHCQTKLKVAAESELSKQRDPRNWKSGKEDACDSHSSHKTISVHLSSSSCVITRLTNMQTSNGNYVKLEWSFNWDKMSDKKGDPGTEPIQWLANGGG